MNWLALFLVHSSLWLGIAWLVSRVFGRMGARTRETVWYTAITACLLTPTIQSVTGDLS